MRSAASVRSFAPAASGVAMRSSNSPSASALVRDGRAVETLALDVAGRAPPAPPPRRCLRRAAATPGRWRPRPAHRHADRCGRTAGLKCATGSRRRIWARARRLAPDRRDSRSGRGSSRPPAGSAPDSAHGHWRAPPPPRRSRSAGASCPAPCAGIPAARPGTARPDAPARLRRASLSGRRPPAPPSRRNDADCGTAASRLMAPSSSSPASELHHGNLQRLARVQRRQQAGQALRQHRLARARRPDHQEVVAAGGGDLQRPLGALLALHVLQVGHGARSVSPASATGGVSTDAPFM